MALVNGSQPQQAAAAGHPPTLIGALRLALVGGLGSRKFIVALAGVLAVAMAPRLGVPQEDLQSVIFGIAGIVAAYLGGQGLADAGKEKARTEAAGATQAGKAP